MAEHRDGGGALRVVLGAQRAPEERSCPEEVEVSAGDERTAEPHDAVAESDRHRLRASESEELDSLQRLRASGILERVTVEQREVIGAAVPRDPPEHHDAILRAHRQRSEEERVGNREHSSREPDA